MDKTVFDKQRVLKGKTPITILALIALFCTVLSSITYFVFYNNYELTFSFPSPLNFISFAMSLTPIVLLTLYVFILFRELNATIVVPIIFGCIAVRPLLNFISAFIYDYELDVITVVMSIITMVTFTLATISALKGLSNKFFIFIPIAMDLALTALKLIINFDFLEFYASKGYTLYLFDAFVSIIANVTFDVALFMYGLMNRIPTILAVYPEKKQKKAEEMTPEQFLRLLKAKLDLGIITEEEYQAQRADIISKL